jgi:hypothetical protein
VGDRIRGQETSTLFVVNNVPILTVADIKSFEMTWMFDVQKEGYLGETTERKDMIFSGISGSLDYHFEQGDIAKIIVGAALDRATRRVPGTQINIKTTLRFGDGTLLRVTIPQANFGAIPMKFQDRKAYGTFTFPFEASGASLA